MISEIFFSLLAKKLMDRHFFYCYWLKIDSEKIALPGERSQTITGVAEPRGIKMEQGK